MNSVYPELKFGFGIMAHSKATDKVASKDLLQLSSNLFLPLHSYRDMLNLFKASAAQKESQELCLMGGDWMWENNEASFL